MPGEGRPARRAVRPARCKCGAEALGEQRKGAAIECQFGARASVRRAHRVEAGTRARLAAESRVQGGAVAGACVLVLVLVLVRVHLVTCKLYFSDSQGTAGLVVGSEATAQSPTVATAGGGLLPPPRGRKPLRPSPRHVSCSQFIAFLLRTARRCSLAGNAARTCCRCQPRLATPPASVARGMQLL